jgi:DNA polymerase-3 subunit alpha
VTDKDLNKKSLESLSKSGALDDFVECGKLLGNIETLLNYNKDIVKAKNNKQVSLFDDLPTLAVSTQLKLKDFPVADRQLKLAWEKELLGLYVSEHPYMDYKKQLTGIAVPLKDLNSIRSDESVIIGGIITKVKKILTRTNKSMMFVKIEDDTGSTELLVFPNLLKDTTDIWQEGTSILCQGKTSDKDQETKILANKVEKLDINNIEKIVKKVSNGKASGSFNSREAEKTIIPAKDAHDLKIVFQQNFDQSALPKLKEIFDKYRGHSRVILEIKIGDETKVIETNYLVNFTPYLATEITNRLGNAIKLVY